MGTSSQGFGRGFPAGGTDGQVPTIDTTNEVDDLKFVDGAATNYTPAVTANWVGTDPTTIQSALDRIAAAITAANQASQSITLT